ncbi:hypothetical protein H0H93_001866 [Arthromyces matolae]|nr:hypothetical protein H0H93_001866 [Arthromyces matolae]
MLFNSLQLPSPKSVHSSSPSKDNYARVSDLLDDLDDWKMPQSVYDAWLTSREIPDQKGIYLVAGAQRPLTLANARLALFSSLRSEVTPRFSNENTVLESAKFYVEREQLKNRVRLDVPTLADPVVRDLLQEADMFAGSFHGNGFGLLSPFDFVRIISLLIELASHVYIVAMLTSGASHLGVLALSMGSVLLPLFLPWCSLSSEISEPLPTEREARAVERHERMRNLAYSDVHRPEIALWGLGDWIVESWSSARRAVAAMDEPYLLRESSLFSQLHLSDLVSTLQNIQLTVSNSGLSYSYPGSSEYALKNTTLAKILLRILDFDSGSLKVNGVDVRRYLPEEYHRHTSAVLQSFSKFNATVQENVGFGYIEQLAENRAVSKAVHLAAADEVVASLPYGLGTTLDNPGFESIPYPGMNPRRHSPQSGLSGGEWQRIAIARAFMRANQPEVDLLLFDEPTICEFGTHQELLNRNGAYAALYNASV